MDTLETLRRSVSMSTLNNVDFDIKGTFEQLKFDQCLVIIHSTLISFEFLSIRDSSVRIVSYASTVHIISSSQNMDYE